MTQRVSLSSSSATGKRRGDDGFTLMEALVALVVLAVGSTALLQAGIAHTRRVSDLETQAAARLIAETRLAEMRLSPQTTLRTAQTVSAFDRSWRVETDLKRTDDPLISRVTLRVDAMDDAGYGARLTGFITAERSP